MIRRLTDRLIPDDAVFLFIFKAWNPRIASYVRISTTQKRGKKTSSGGMRLFGNRLRLLNRTCISYILLLAALISPTAQAHLMGAQNGTLNWVDSGVFMVLSLPVSAFEGIDDNQDGKVSKIELDKHRPALVSSIKQQVTLSDARKKHPLEGILLSPVIEHNPSQEAISQLVVMGRFNLVDPCDLQMHIGLYGKASKEQAFKITTTRPSHDQKHVFHLTPKSPTATILPAAIN